MEKDYYTYKPYLTKNSKFDNLQGLKKQLKSNTFILKLVRKENKFISFSFNYIKY